CCVFGVFVFQAEDGIRCLHVTGVQTGALPICTVRAVDHAPVRHPEDLEPRRPYLLGKALPEPVGGFAFQQLWCRAFGDRFACGLRNIPDIGRAYADHPATDGLSGLRLLATVQTPPRVRIRRIRRREPAGDGGEDLIPGLALLDLAAQLLPLLVAGNVGRERLGNAALLENFLVLLPDEHYVVEAARAELGGEPQRYGPVIPGDQPLDGTGELAVEFVELRLPRLAGLFLPRRHRPASSRRTGPGMGPALHLRGEPGASGEAEGRQPEQSVR